MAGVAAFCPFYLVTLQEGWDPSQFEGVSSERLHGGACLPPSLSPPTPSLAQRPEHLSPVTPAKSPCCGGCHP